jgi:hypothetical protein
MSVRAFMRSFILLGCWTTLVQQGFVTATRHALQHAYDVCCLQHFLRLLHSARNPLFLCGFFVLPCLGASESDCLKNALLQHAARCGCFVFGPFLFRRLVHHAKPPFFLFGLRAGVRGVVCRSLFRPGLVAAPCSTQLHRLSPPAVSSAAAQRDTTQKNFLLGVFLFFGLRDVGACLLLHGRVPALCAVWLCCLLPAPVSSLVPLRPLPDFFWLGFFGLVSCRVFGRRFPCLAVSQHGTWRGCLVSWRLRSSAAP